MSRWARRRDSNHGEIRDRLRECGVWVVDTGGAAGFVDLVAWYAGRFHLLEVKREFGPKGGGGGELTEAQTKLRDSCPGPIHVVRTFDEALEAIGARRR